MNFRYSLYFFIILFLTQSCNTDNIPDPGYTSGTIYYPIQEGWYISYQIDTVNIDFDNEDADENGVVSENSIQLKELIEKPYDDGFGGQNYKLIRFKRDNEEMEWELDSIWALAYRNNHVIRYENAIPYLKLVNPLRERMKFNQNNYNGLPSKTPEGFDLRYEVEAVGRPFTFEGLSFDNTAIIKEINNVDLTESASEVLTVVYQKDIGLVCKDYSNTEKRYYEFTTAEPTLVGNPYCGSNSNLQTITLGNGDKVDNAFYAQDNCEENPIFGVERDSAERWLASWENTVNSPVITWSTGDNNTIIVKMIHPLFFNGYNEVGTLIKQNIIGYGIDVSID